MRRRKKQLLLLVTALSSFSGSSFAAPPECRYNTLPEAEQAIRILTTELRELSEIHGKYFSWIGDYFSALGGCAGSIEDQVRKKLAAFQSLAKATSYPPSPEACVHLTVAHDQTKSWLFQYKRIREPHRPGTPRLPEVCETGRIQVSYDGPCKAPPERMAAVGLTAQNLSTFTDSEAAAFSTGNAPTSKEASNKPNVPAPHLSGPRRLDRKTIDKRETELIEAVRDEMRDGKKPTLSSLAATGELLIHSELNDADPKDQPAELDSEYLAAWKAQVATYRKLFAASKGKVITERLNILAKAINEDYTRKYDNRDDLRWNRPSTRLIELLEGEGGNCQADAKMNFALLAAVVGDELPPYLVPAVQTLGHHVAVVIYDKDENTIWDMTSGGKPVPYTKGELYQGALLLNSDLSYHGKSTVDAKELLIATPLNPPSAEDQKAAIALKASEKPKDGDNRTALPPSIYGLSDPLNMPRFAVQAYVEFGKEPTVERVKKPNLPDDTNGKNELKALGLMGQVKSELMPETNPRHSLVEIDLNYRHIFFAYQEDQAKYESLPNVEEKRKFLISLGQTYLNNGATFFSNEKMDETLANPEKWNDRKKASQLSHAIALWSNGSRLLRKLGVEYEIKPETLAAVAVAKKKLTIAKLKLNALATGRPEVLLRAINSAPAKDDGSDSILEVVQELEWMDGEDPNATGIHIYDDTVVISALEKAIGTLPKAYLGRGGKYPLSQADVAVDPPPPLDDASLALVSSKETGIPPIPTRRQSRAPLVKKKTKSAEAGGGIAIRKLLQLYTNNSKPLPGNLEFSEEAIESLKEWLRDPLTRRTAGSSIPIMFVELSVKNERLYKSLLAVYEQEFCAYTSLEILRNTDAGAFCAAYLKKEKLKH